MPTRVVAGPESLTEQRTVFILNARASTTAAINPR
jgi:hypothetical protein